MILIHVKRIAPQLTVTRLDIGQERVQGSLLVNSTPNWLIDDQPLGLSWNHIEIGHLPDLDPGRGIHLSQKA